jgi:alpha-tubulin suppressor-like RCC1 family protein
MRRTHSVPFLVSCCLLLAAAGCSSGSGSDGGTLPSGDAGHVDAGGDGGAPDGGPGDGGGPDAGPDVCNPSPCDANATCSRGAGGEATCACNPNFVGNGKTCTIEICKAGQNGGCDANAKCTPTSDNSARTCTCNGGYIGTGEKCIADVCNPPGAAHAPCDGNATCTRSGGNAVCTCNDKYVGSGQFSADPAHPGCSTDFCKVDSASCDMSATCVNTLTAATCTCAAGYMLGADMRTCADINECLVNNGGCPPHTDCHNTPGSFTCVCSAGYAGDPSNCMLDSPCTHAICPLHSVCLDMGLGTCPCDSGYAANTATNSCDDVNECLTNNGGCATGETCVNTPGSFRCSCSAGSAGVSGACHAGYSAPIACGYEHVCTVGTDGSMWCWGDNVYGEWGNGTNWSPTASVPPLNPNAPPQYYPPQQAGSDKSWTSVSSGGYFSCGIKADHSVWCWGGNFYGNVGNGFDSGIDYNATTGTGSSNNSAAPTPSQVVGNWTDVQSLGLGTNHACAIRKNATTGAQTLWCWGADDYGQLGNSKTTPLCGPPGCTEGGQQNTPIQVGMDTDWSAVAGGLSHTCALKLDGSLWCWGRNRYGELGTGTASTTPTLVPTKVAEPPGAGMSLPWTAVSAREEQTCGVAGGQLYCWGDNSYSEAGDCTGAANDAAPNRVGMATDWVQVSVGKLGACGVRGNNNAYCWGDNTFGEIGNGTGLDSCNPRQVNMTTGSNVWSGVCSGEYFSCGVQSDNSGWCWGIDKKNDLGDASVSNSSVPVPTR